MNAASVETGQYMFDIVMRGPGYCGRRHWREGNGGGNSRAETAAVLTGIDGVAPIVPLLEIFDLRSSLDDNVEDPRFRLTREWMRGNRAGAG